MVAKTETEATTEKRRLLDCMQRFDEGRLRVQLDMPATAAIQVVAQMQLALRHPKNTGRTSANARIIVESIIRSLESLDSAAGLLRRGDDPQYDVDFADS